MKKIIILFLFCSLVWSEESIDLLNKAKEIYEKTTKTQKIEEIEIYNQIAQILKEALQKTEDKEIKKQIYPLLIETLDLIAEYKEKHKAMKEYAQLIYPEEREKQAEYLKEYADKLKEKGEIGEAISLYRFIIFNFIDIKITLNCCFIIVEILEGEGDIKKAADELLNFAFKFSEDEKIVVLIIEAAKKYKNIKNYKKAIECLERVINEYKNVSKTEDALFAIGFYYEEMGNKNKAEEFWRKYIEVYPNGKYISIINAQLKK
ncbi:MAG: tetratricopeptide repeat protein [Candidatus Ratteibacteria bacterium]